MYTHVFIVLLIDAGFGPITFKSPLSYPKGSGENDQMIAKGL